MYARNRLGAWLSLRLGNRRHIFRPKLSARDRFFLRTKVLSKTHGYREDDRKTYNRQQIRDYMMRRKGIIDKTYPSRKTD